MLMESPLPFPARQYALFVDHAAYGRPFSGFPSASSPCSAGGGGGGDLFAQTEKEYCVAASSLKAVTYWCQGKRGCGFPHRWIVDVGEAKEFFVAKVRR